MQYLRTKLATDWPEKEGIAAKLWRIALFFIPEANPGYRGKYHLVQEWLIEFDDEGNPFREIGLGKNGEVVLAGPDNRNYGYWLDTNMTLTDFEGLPSSKEEFSSHWDGFENNQWQKKHAI